MGTLMTRAELDARWARLEAAVSDVDTTEYPTKFHFFSEWLAGLIAEERAIVDRATQARAIRWAVHEAWSEYPPNSTDLLMLADRVELGDVEIP
jgi:hypothetical protein